MMLALLLLLMLLPAGPTTVDVEVIELNHVYSVHDARDEDGRYVRQVHYTASYWLAWEMTADGLHVRDWVKDGPATTLAGDTLIVVARKQVLQIRGKVVREIVSSSDRERDDQANWPIARRRLIEGLRR